MIKLNQEYIENNSTPEPNTGCWLWDGYCNPDGYGQRKVAGKTLRMHRVSYSLFHGEIPRGECVLHKCDTPACCNPEHLFVGTHADNMNDMWNKRRHPAPKSEPYGKLTREEVDEIKALKGDISGIKLSHRYCVNAQSIYNIWNGVTWRDS